MHPWVFSRPVAQAPVSFAPPDEKRMSAFWGDREHGRAGTRVQLDAQASGSGGLGGADDPELVRGTTCGHRRVRAEDVCPPEKAYMPNTMPKRTREDEPSLDPQSKRARMENPSQKDSDWFLSHDERDFMDNALDRPGNEHRRHDADDLGFSDDQPTLSMLADLEHFLFTQRQRWFGQGRLYALKVFNGMNTRAIDIELQQCIHSLQEQNAALNSKLSYCRERIDQLETELHDAERRPRDLYEPYDDARQQRRENVRFTTEREDDRISDSVRVQKPKTPAQGGSSRGGHGSALRIADPVPPAISTRTVVDYSDITPAGPERGMARARDGNAAHQHVIVPTRPRVDDNSGVAAERLPPPDTTSIPNAAAESRPGNVADSVVMNIVAVAQGREYSEPYFDPNVGTYDQRSLIEKTVEEDIRRRNALRLEAPDRERPTHFIWTMAEYNTPIPLGRYGQPYFRGSAWEDFNPLRLMQAGSPGYVERGTPLWVRLAEDAAQLPFEFRSLAQRIVVSEAHHFKPAGSQQCVLPMEGDVAEADVWHQCVANALYMPLAIRRQYTFDRARGVLYREWDAGDIGIYIVMRACGPAVEKNRGKKRKEAGETGKDSGAKWTELFRAAVLWGSESSLSVEPGEFSRPRQHSGPETPEAVYAHLLRCGFTRERMAKGGDVYNYALRLGRMDTEFKELKSRVENSGELLDAKNVVARVKCMMEVNGSRIPQERPVVRCKVSAKDPLANELLTELRKLGRRVEK